MSALAALREIRRILAPGAPLCLSTAVRMESIDHLYVFNTPDEVRSLLRTAGFTIVKDRCYPLAGGHTDETDTAEQASNVRDAMGFVALGTTNNINA
jgi:hypothetical protein